MEAKIVQEYRLLAGLLQSEHPEEYVKEAAAALEQAADIIAKLPVTADGVAVVPGMVVIECYGVDDPGSEREVVMGTNNTYEQPTPINEYCEHYSTRAAAEAAKGGE